MLLQKFLSNVIKEVKSMHFSRKVWNKIKTIGRIIKNETNRIKSEINIWLDNPTANCMENSSKSNDHIYQ